MNKRLNFKTDIDGDLMVRIADKEREAFVKLVNRNLTNVFRFAYSMLGDVSRAEDVAQETFEKVWVKAGSWKPTGTVRSWLFRIAHNLCVDELRKGKKQTYVEVPEMVDESQRPDKDAYKKQKAAIIKNAMLSLPERQREAMTLVYHQGCSNIEAARIMDVSVDGLESLLARGRKGLKKKLEKHKRVLLGEIL